MRRSLCIFSGVLWLLLSLSSFADPGLTIATKLELSATPLRFGQPSTLLIDLSWNKDWGFQPPAPESLSLEGFTIIDAFTTKTSQATTEREQLRYHLLFTRFEAGRFTVPPVTFATPTGQKQSQAQPITYEGSQALSSDKPGELRGPKEAMELPTTDFWIWVLKASLVTLVALVLLGALIQRLGFLDRFFSPRHKALRQLKRLQRQLKQNQLTPENLLIELVEVARAYLHQAYHLTTREATSQEITEQLSLNNRCTAIKPVIKDLLDHGDQTKFAGQSHQVSQVLDLLERLRASLKTDPPAQRKPSRESRGAN